MLEEYDLTKPPPELSMRDHFKNHSQTFYEGLLDLNQPVDPLLAQSRTPLHIICPVEVARACERVAVGHGLPPDGVVVHGAYAGVF
eukprot:10641623-Karenia_brevis.AAC.1